MKFRRFLNMLLVTLAALLLCCGAKAENPLETMNALGEGAMPCLGNPKVIVFSVWWTDNDQPQGNVIDWTNGWYEYADRVEHIYFDPALKEDIHSPKTYDLEYDSLRSFYYRSSYGKLDITGDAYIYFTKHPGEYYTDCGMLLDEILEHCEEYIDWSQYDDNQDGYVDGIYIWPTSDPSWEMADRMSFVSYSYANTVNDMKVSRYAYIIPYTYTNYTDGIRTIAHETFHLLGIKDIYQGSGLNPNGLRAQSVMDQSMGDIPEICKWFFGWMDPPQVLAGEGEWEIELSSVSVTDDWLIVYPLGNADSDVIFVVDYVTNEANNQDTFDDASPPYHGVRIWRVHLNGQNTATDPHGGIMPFDYIEAVSLSETFPECFYQPGDSFTPWTTPSSDYATAYEYTTTGLVTGPLNELCYIAEHEYSGIYIDILSMDGETAKLRVKIEPVLDLTGSEAVVEVIDPKNSGVVLDHNDCFTFAMVSCPYGMTVNGQLSLRHAASGEQIPVTYLLSEDTRKIWLMIAKEDLPKVQLDQEYHLQLQDKIIAFNGDELSFGDFNGTVVIKDIPISLTKDNAHYQYGSQEGEFRFFYKSEKEVCYFWMDRNTKECYLSILNIETKEDAAVLLETCEPLQESWLKAYEDLGWSHTEDYSFHIWQIDKKYFAIAFKPADVYVDYMTVVMYDFEGHLIDVMDVHNAECCVGQIGERYIVYYDVAHVDEPLVAGITVKNGKLAISEVIEFPFDVEAIISEVNNINEIADDTYSVTLMLHPDNGRFSTLDLYPVQFVFKNGQKVATIPNAGFAESMLRIGEDVYLVKLTDNELMLDVFDKNGQLKKQLTLFENLPEKFHAGYNTHLVAQYADDTLYVSFSTFSDKYERSYSATYLVAFDMDLNFKYYFHSDNFSLDYGTPFYIDDDVFFYTQDDNRAQHLYLDRCDDDTEHIQTKKYGKSPTDTESGWTDGIVCGKCGKVIVPQKSIAHSNCSAVSGDANDDGQVDAYDALSVLQYIAGWDVSMCAGNADMNGDSTVNLDDALKILERCLNGDMSKALRALQVLMRSMSITKLQIVEQPVSQDVVAGEQVQFTVKAVGDGLTYQWYINRNDGKGWSQLSGAVDASCKTAAAMSWSNDDQYRCVITDVYGNEVTSATATLHVVFELPVTGDAFTPMVWVIALLTSAAGLAIMLKKRFAA